MRRLWTTRPGSWDPSTRVLVLVALWLLTRAAVLVGTRATGLYPYQDDAFDVEGFAVWGRAFTGEGGEVPLRDVPWEYPFGAVPVVALPALLRGAPYALGFVAEMVLLDALLLLLLLHRGTRAGGSLVGAAWWVAAVPLLGPVALARFDVVPALLAAAGLLAVPAAPLTAGVVLGMGALVKLWPGVLVPLALLAVWPRRDALVRVLAGAVGVGVVGLALAAAVYGTEHLLAFLTYQDERGLEVESVPALPLLLGAVLADRPAVVGFAFGSYQVEGPGGPLLVAVADAAVPLVVLAVTALAWRARRSADPVQAALVLGVLLLAAVLVVDKVLSAQYPLWLAAVLAAALTRRDSPLRRALVPAAGVLLLTQLVYPLLIQDLVALQARPVLLLAVRDALLVGLAVWLCAVAWRVTRPAPPADADRPHRGGGDLEAQGA